MEQQHNLPNQNTLSILVSTILLAYTLTQFVSIPTTVLEFSIAGVYLPLTLNYSTIVSLVVVGLTATGTAWMLADHPAAANYQQTMIHWLLPSLTSMVLMLTIQQLPFGGTWWIAAAVSGGILMLVFTAEYCVLDVDNPYYTAAEIGITALSLALFLILAIAVHAAEIRLFYRIPIISLSAFLVFIRVIHLREHGVWAIPHASAVFLLMGELAAGLHYWPMASIPFGISLLGPLYALIEISSRIYQADHPVSARLVYFPLGVTIFSWLLAVLV